MSPSDVLLFQETTCGAINFSPGWIHFRDYWGMSMLAKTVHSAKSHDNKKDTDSLCVAGDKDTSNLLNHCRLSLNTKISAASFVVLKYKKLYFVLYMVNVKFYVW